MNTIARVFTPFKYSPITILIALFLTLLFSQSTLAARHSYVANLGELDTGSLTPFSGNSPRRSGYLFTLADDGLVSVDVDANNHRRRHQPKVRLWDTDTHSLLGKNSDIQDLALSSDTVYKLVVSGGGHGHHRRHSLGYDGLITVAPPSEVPLPAAIWLFGSALVGLASVARRRAAKA